MNRITEMFNNLKQKNQKAFIGFLTAGDPNLETCKELILELDKNGCDLIELGVPFSDPIAEGPTIQDANVRALKNKVTSRLFYACDTSFSIILTRLQAVKSILSYLIR